MRFHGRIGIDTSHNGLALDWAEGERIAHVAGQTQGEREQSGLFFQALRRILPAPR